MVVPGSDSRLWWHGAVIYQIWPRSFADADGDGIGDLRGIIDRLDYLNDGLGGGLGVDAIWLSPIFVSPLADYGYDISDFTSIDPTFGTLEDLDQLISECHRREIRLLLDLVPNHTSDQHPWFLEARHSRDSEKRDWYRWRDPGPDGGPPNNWRSAFASVGPAWTFDPTSGQYYHHSYTASQPDLNWDNAQVREAMADIVRFWFDRGVDGFRVDVAHRLGKDPAYGDNEPFTEDIEPTGPGRRDADWPSGLEYLREIRAVADRYTDRLLVGEVYILDQSRVIQYLLGGDGLHLAHNFVFFNLGWSAQDVADTVRAFEDQSGPLVEPAWCLNNHDHSRVRTRFDFDGLGEERARCAAMLLLGLRGTIFLYQGEELGLPDTELAHATAVDVDGRDPARTPIPWASPSSAGPGAGFTTGTPWLPIGPTAEQLNVADQRGDDDSMLEHYRRLIRLRNASSALRLGTYREMFADDQSLVFERRLGDDVVIVAVNFSTEMVGFPTLGSGVERRTLVSTQRAGVPEAADPLAPLEARWLQTMPQKTT